MLSLLSFAGLMACCVEIANAGASMKPVTSIHARVINQRPQWDADHGAFVSLIGKTFAERHRALMDTVNTASVEGALTYVQSECINVVNATRKCERKSNVSFVVFHEMTIVQPENAVKSKWFQNRRSSAVEYCPYAAMDLGKCSGFDDTNAEDCKHYVDDVGLCVGATRHAGVPLASYPDTYWFSFPNHCPTSDWFTKNDTCRQKTQSHGGLCEFGVQPDGIKCSFATSILGYIELDEVVGITSLVNPTTKKPFANYSEFCHAGGVEFNATSPDNKTWTVHEALPFWKRPQDKEANKARVQTLVDKYNEKVKRNHTSVDGGVMRPLPTLRELTDRNPPCKDTSRDCEKRSCKRHTYGQVCEVVACRSHEAA
ncbi:TPA: hypothetical protein N0F65_003414 [Lagenidium giganteum]|uniref:Uncharacterized protein n=1 Tax=Lagenidium giganteum TaxID=4803 RepID=A0AAV2YKN0_9STRA|nr:TPA: hypothetical protein N0F65_003414 [Lagenidium giganteum]